MTGIPEGYSTKPGFDAAEDHIGPFYYCESDKSRYAFVSRKQNGNVEGIVHGGVLMTFADFALCMAATDHYQLENCVTVSFSSDFVSAAPVGELVEAIVQVTRKTRSLAFVTGRLVCKDEIVMTFSSVVKRLIDRGAT